MSWGLEGASVAFGGATALDDVTLVTDPGRVTVVVGGDGAGKSTCLRALVGLVRLDRGTVRAPSKDATGYVPATEGVYEDLTVAENARFVADAFGLDRSRRDEAIAALLDRTGVRGAEDRLAGHLSGGMRRKLAVGLALLHDPALLVLDEPTTGVDPVSRSGLWRLITGAAARGAAVVVATTYVNEAARATSVVLLQAGTVLASGTPEAILGGVPGAVGHATHPVGAAGHRWGRGRAWRVWAPDGKLPPGCTRVTPDFEDAVVVAELARPAGGR
jgi:ABC-2 type transport system ATP-binding protein